MNNMYEVVNLLRKQRHDFMNYVQVIYGYVQMGKIEKAEEYIDKLSGHNEIISQLYLTGDNILAYCLENVLKELWQDEIEVSVDLETNGFTKKVFENNTDKKIDVIKKIFLDLKKEELKKVYIYFFEDELGESLFISNDENMVDEINWMENWEAMLVDIDDIKLHKCKFKNQIAYRITFV